MKKRFILFVLASVAASSTTFAEDAGSAKNSDGCKIVHLKSGENPPSGTFSSSVTAGGGTVLGTTTGGNSVTVHSGNGNVSSSMTTGSSSGGNTTTVTSANGECTVYIRSGK